MARRRVGVDMTHLLDAMASTGGTRFYLEVATGEIVVALSEDAVDVNVDVEDPDHLEVPRWAGDESVLDRFVREVESDHRDWVATAAADGFESFLMALVNRPELHLAWHRQVREAMLVEALAWFEKAGLEPIYEVKPVELPGFEPTSVGPDEEEIGLLDILLLGRRSADELDGERVERRLKTATEEGATRLFKTIVRQWCTFRGKDFRQQMAPGAREFELGRLRVRREEDGVVVSVGVSKKARSLAKRSRG